ncbi:MAG: glycoside hydrolase family 95 protein [Opitutae bacterium]|nr:glycoside hydrolase family 95 protein [Opitutae bacterium]
MKKRISLIFSVMLLFVPLANLFAAPAVPPSKDVIWFDSEAMTFSVKGDAWKILRNDSREVGKGWEFEGLPIGNGRIGAMVLGNAARERIALNEITLWTGGENSGANCSGYSYGPTSGRDEFGAYQPFGDLLAEFPGLDKPTDFTRSLALGTGIARTTFSKNGVRYRRVTFTSFPMNVLVSIYSADKRGALSGTFLLSPNHSAKFFAQSNKLGMTGTLANGMKFAARAAVIATGKTAKTIPVGGNADISVSYEKNLPVFDSAKLPRIKVEKADRIVVLVAMKTDYLMSEKKNWKGGDPVPAAEKLLKAATEEARNPTALEAAHIRAHRELFDRVEVDLGSTDKETARLPTPKRLEKYKTEKNDPDLEETLFQFGRYCLMCSSYESAPATLQGIWNHRVKPPWACDYHTNINIQEAYWAAEVGNLSECAMPLFNWLEATKGISERISQKAFKGQDGKPPRGWTSRVSQNIFGAGGWTMWNNASSAWYALHIWEHYEFTQDKKFLKEIGYPMMKEICHFWEDMLKPLGAGGAGFRTDEENADLAQLKDIKAGTLVAPNGWSHEWGPVEDGVTHDQQLISNLFSNTIKAAKVLGTDRKWAESLAKKRARLYGNKISKGGYLQEWMIDRPDLVTGHRHTSHLFAVFPGNEISTEKTPELAAAAKKSLELRGTNGDSRRSWSWPWRTALWARFKEGEKAHEMVEGLLAYNTLPNLLTTHEPFQMDGNFSFPAGVAEMLLQSHAGEIVLLPAPCKAWRNGKVRGLKARGNITVDFEWKAGRVTSFRLWSPEPQEVLLVMNDGKPRKIMTKAISARK